MKYQEIKALSPQERQAKLAAEVENLQKLRFAHAISPIENPMRIRHSKKLIAQLKTAQDSSERSRNAKKLANSHGEKP